MSVEHLQNTEIITQPQIESFQATLDQVNQVPVVYAETSPKKLAIDYVLRESGWVFSYVDVDKVATPLDPQNPDDAALLAEAAEAYRADDETKAAVARYTRWWEQGDSRIKEAVNTHIQDRLAITTPEIDNQVDVVNTTQESLSDEEQAVIAQAVGSVVNMTGGKVFERLRGVVLADDSGFDKHVWGGHSTYGGGIITINLGAIREAVNQEKGTFKNQFSSYFPDSTPLQLTLGITIAHEFGHAMDIRSTEDVGIMGVEDETMQTTNMGDMTADFSVFDKGLGWEDKGIASVHPGSKRWRGHWKIDPAQEVELREEAPTRYARTNPGEDFAETFAIMALGGDKTKLPNRVQIMADGLQKLHQADLHGPFKLDVERLVDEPLKAKIPDQIVLNAGISKELAKV